jgi:hypothetical protein
MRREPRKRCTVFGEPRHGILRLRAVVAIAAWATAPE